MTCHLSKSTSLFLELEQAKKNTETMAEVVAVSKTGEKLKAVHAELTASSLHEDLEKQSKNGFNSLEKHVVHDVIHSRTTDSYPISDLTSLPTVSFRRRRVIESIRVYVQQR